MTRSLPRAVHLAHGSWVWAADVPRLVVADGAGRGDALALLRAMAADAPEGSALQLRHVTRGAGTERVPPYLIGRARTEEAAIDLARLAALTLPTGIGFRPVATDEVVARLAPEGLDRAGASGVLELRRVVDTLDPSRPVVVPWSAAARPIDLGGLLDRAGGPTVLCVHVERMPASTELTEQLQATVQDLLDDDLADDPTLRRSLLAHRAWLRELPGSALQVRVSLASPEPLSPGLADLVGSAVTESDAEHADRGGYTIVRPANPHQLDLALQLFDSVRAGFWGLPDDGQLPELRFLFAPSEATAAFRLPSRPEGDVGSDHAGPSSFPATRALLRRLATTSAIPFLVLDLSRGDYGGVADELQQNGVPVRRLRLDPSVRGFDPFALPAGMPHHAHAGRLLAALDLAFGLSRSAPAAWVLLNRAMYDAYDAAQGAPGLRPLIDAADRLTNRLGLGDRGGYELRAELLGRLELLEAGPLGAVLCSGATVDWAELLARPTVIELGGLPTPADRLLVAGLLLAGLLTHRDARPLEPGSRHVVVLAGATGEFTGTDASAALGEGIAALAGSGQEFVLADVSTAAPMGPLPAPDAWGLPILDRTVPERAPVASPLAAHPALGVTP